ncbi:hypothetical protein [Oceanirhabdus seepicola]|uniref:DUF4129 domain-containing protein n=1 Tax=Oceanirhabdus seepicola TaxID=2828781 RepID=A0A9J6PA25_9CLOT|nr:hypothetical protein [Oceanirhabdus seepicola]MCM1992617.1 hypothetical protein [Oceanirhabdus seepicola]
MSWNREIKTLLTFTILLLSFIIWSFLINLFGGIDINHNMFLITSLGCFIMQLIYNKSNNKNKKIISCAIPIVFTIPLYFLNHTIFSGAAYSLYNVAMIIYINSIEENGVDYSTYHDMSLKALIVFLIVSVSTIIADQKFASELFRYYVFLLVVIVMLLRESRNFMFKIRSKYSKYFNLFISGSILLVCFGKGEVILDFFKKYLMLIIDKTFDVLFWIISFPLTLLFNAFSKLAKNIHSEDMEDLINAPDKIFKDKDLFEEALTLQENDNNNFIFQGLKIIVFILIVFLLVKFFLKLMNKSKVLKEDTKEIREEIKTSKEYKKNGKLKKIFKKIFRGNLSVNMRIFEVFKEFQITTKKKEIFKKYMTASQLKKVTKMHVDTPNELDGMALIYNEAKFSDHEMTETQYTKIKENYSEIKKQL